MFIGDDGGSGAGGGGPAALCRQSRPDPRLCQGHGRLAKTDALDARVIALFAERIRPEARPVAAPDAARLAEWVARRRQVIEMIGMEANRRRRTTDKPLARTIERHIAFLEKGLADIDATSATVSRARRSGARRRRCSSPSQASAK